MAVFQYQGRDKDGQLVEGQLSASSTEAVVDELAHKGIIPINVEPASKLTKPFAFLQKKIFIPAVKTEDLIAFCRQMYSLVKAGIPLLKILTLILDTTRSDALAKSLREIIDDIMAGQTLTNSMRKHPKVFPPLFLSLVDAGENSGQLDTIFLQLSEYLELMDRTKKQIKTATRYPTLVVSAIITALLIVNFFVVPNFAKIFSRFQVVLPLPTRILLTTSNFLINNWILLLLAIITTLIGLRFYLKTDRGKYLWDRWKLRIPFFGPIINRILFGRFARSFAMIFRTGVPLVQGIELVANVIDNAYMRERILVMREGIERGETLTKTVSDTHLFPPMILQMFSSGEEAGTVDTLLQEAAVFYEREVEYDLRHLSDIIEPILLVCLGVMVLVLALGIFLPMWDMVKFVQK